jgi:tRNA A37 N6-isopentenylltransferase MiaA
MEQEEAKEIESRNKAESRRYGKQQRMNIKKRQSKENLAQDDGEKEENRRK